MKKLNKKGFTLVELLAVIVVLAIIMVLVLPNVMDSMNSAKQQTFLLYANRMLSAAMDRRASDDLVGDAKNCYLISTLNNGNTTKYTGKVTYNQSTKEYRIQMYDNDYQIGFSNKPTNIEAGTTYYDKEGGVTSAEIETIKTNLKNAKDAANKVLQEKPDPAPNVSC